MRSILVALLLLTTPAVAEDLPIGSIVAGHGIGAPMGWVPVDGGASCEIYRKLCDQLPAEYKPGGVVSIDLKGKICTSQGRCYPDGVTWFIKAY